MTSAKPAGTDALFKFIRERYSVFLKKELGKPKPWTKDPVLQSYRFCNVYREDDAVTRWIATNWREPHEDDPNVWFAFAVARLINLPATMAAIGYPSPWKRERFLKVMAKRRAAKEQMYSGAYIIHSGSGLNNEHVGTTYDYQESKVFTPLWADRKNFPHSAHTLREIFVWIKTHECYGDFMAAQVIADLKYVPLFGEDYMDDWGTFVAPGPGSRKGLAIVYGLPVYYNWKTAEWMAAFANLKPFIDIKVEKAGMPFLHAQDLQNCLCEFSKYVRGSSRSKYPGGK